jgi:hypothetical protein
MHCVGSLYVLATQEGCAYPIVTHTRGEDPRAYG